MKEYTDNEIIECLRTRQSYVVRYLFSQYLPMIKYMIKQQGGSYEEAKDIFQEALMIILERLDNREFTLTCRFRTFLYCICEKLWKAELKKKRKAETYQKNNVVTVEDTDVSEQLDDDIHQEIFRKAYEEIDPVGKEILKLSWRGFFPMEIAKKLNYTNGYIRKKKSEVQNLLLEKVKNHPEYGNIRIPEEVVKNSMDRVIEDKRSELILADEK